MSEIQRICVQCGYANPLESRYCARCGYDSQGALPALRPSLPAVIGRAALPVLVGAASVALRVGWKLLQQRGARAQSSPAPQPVMRRPAAPPAPRPAARTRRTIHIRSTWATGDASGVWQQGSSEHFIEIEE
ncbi:MAG: zinc ribbon domain-containing protein [Caldilineaceae bacterium]|nr:zinc ribbon domain-containing protein [Caldilineaceae bacterium]